MTLAPKYRGIAGALLASNLVSLLLFLLRLFATGSTAYWFLFWNLFLAWIPVVLVLILKRVIIRKSWLHPLPVVITGMWLVFLPNSFYIISDLIHLQNTGDIGILFDVVLFMSFIWNGALAGVLSMFWVHSQLLKRKSAEYAAWCMTIVIALTSFAIYLGRSLRWNTWDIVTRPAGLLFDVSERFINPLAYPEALVTTLTFFVLIGSIYVVIWSFIQFLSVKK